MIEAQTAERHLGAARARASCAWNLNTRDRDPLGSCGHLGVADEACLKLSVVRPQRVPRPLFSFRRLLRASANSFASHRTVDLSRRDPIEILGQVVTESEGKSRSAGEEAHERCVTASVRTSTNTFGAAPPLQRHQRGSSWFVTTIQPSTGAAMGLNGGGDSLPTLVRRDHRACQNG